MSIWDQGPTTVNKFTGKVRYAQFGHTCQSMGDVLEDAHTAIREAESGKWFYLDGYPCALVLMIHDGTSWFIDGMNGLNAGHALHRARENWDGCEIRILRTVTV